MSVLVIWVVMLSSRYLVVDVSVEFQQSVTVVLGIATQKISICDVSAVEM
jgi:hypothetical protein